MKNWRLYCFLFLYISFDFDITPEVWIIIDWDLIKVWG